MQRQEIQYHTPDQVREYLAQARDMVDLLNLPAELEAAAFTVAAHLLSAKSINIVQPQPVDLSEVLASGRMRH